MTDTQHVSVATHAGTTTDYAPADRRFAAAAIDAGIALLLAAFAGAVYYLGYTSGDVTTYYLSLIVAIIAVVALVAVTVYQVLLLGSERLHDRQADHGPSRALGRDRAADRARELDQALARDLGLAAHSAHRHARRASARSSPSARRDVD